MRRSPAASGAAEAGTLAIMVGGDTAGLDSVLPALQRIARFTHMGPTGVGQATELVNQVLCLTNYCIAAEGLRLAQAFGVDAAKIPHALEPGHANSAVLQVDLCAHARGRLRAARLCPCRLDSFASVTASTGRAESDWPSQPGVA